jgi:hypothetical protein
MFLTLAWVLGVDVLALRGIASEVEDHLWPAYKQTGGVQADESGHHDRLARSARPSPPATRRS